MVSAWLAFLAGLVAAYLVPLACASLLARRPSSSSSHELYSSTADDALLLNLEPPATRWFNMGYWPRTQLSSSSSSSFAAAAADLCRLVARAAHLGPNQRICVRSRSLGILRFCWLVPPSPSLTPRENARVRARSQEVGYGSGDSTLLLEREFRPARYLGLTSLASQHATAGESPCGPGSFAPPELTRPPDCTQSSAHRPPASRPTASSCATATPRRTSRPNLRTVSTRSSPSTARTSACRPERCLPVRARV